MSASLVPHEETIMKTYLLSTAILAALTRLVIAQPSDRGLFPHQPC